MLEGKRRELFFQEDFISVRLAGRQIGQSRQTWLALRM